MSETADARPLSEASLARISTAIATAMAERERPREHVARVIPWRTEERSAADRVDARGANGHTGRYSRQVENKRNVIGAEVVAKRRQTAKSEPRADDVAGLGPDRYSSGGTVRGNHRQVADQGRAPRNRQAFWVLGLMVMKWGLIRRLYCRWSKLRLSSKILMTAVAVAGVVVVV